MSFWVKGNHFSKADLSGPSYFIPYEFVLVNTSIPLEKMKINIILEKKEKDFTPHMMFDPNSDDKKEAEKELKLY